jgi:hypothetical protein
MLVPRAVHPATSLLRSFSSLAVAYRCPSIRDITIESTEGFLIRQKEFRENLEQARLRKEQKESQSINAFSSSSSLPVDSLPLLRK